MHIQEGTKTCERCKGLMTLVAKGRNFTYKCESCGYEESYELI